MRHVLELKRLLGKHLNWHGSRITFLSLFIISMLQTRTVNLTKIANGFAKKGKKSGKVRRTEEFFRRFEIEYDDIARLLSSFIENMTTWTLTMDRTNWKIGKVNINILYLAVAYKSIAIPLFWSLLQIKDDNGESHTKRGNSNTKERIAIIDRFINVFGVKRIEVLTGDREFVGKKWLEYLEEKGINFCMREKKSKLIKHKGKNIPIKVLFQDLKLGEYHYFGKIKIYGMELHLTGSRMKDDYLILLTNYEAPKDEILLTYSKRWEIETMFKSFKSKGFNLEDTHLTKKDRIEKLLALMAIAFVWSYIAGEFYEQIEPIKLKKN